MSENFKKMMQLVQDFFDVKNDPEQLNVTEEVIDRLYQMHPAALTEYVAGDGPVVWILVMPTTHELMEQFLNEELSEQQLFDQTPTSVRYSAVYLCSATVLPEYRKRGLAKKMTIDAVRSISEQHNIDTLFYWPFSNEGVALAESIARELELPLYKRKS